ncbi:MAG: 1-deoxy-D-xylulose-5-phosphate reductoisomerase [Clostridia bacterium]|nr:1-deoxy-D-xylulose-5-phosphate reductoisomerase [Clostridia bacterium]
MKKISILGSTGSIGTQALNILANFPEEFKIIALSGSQNWELLYQQALKFKPKYVVLADDIVYASKKECFEKLNCIVLSGIDGLIEIATLDEADLVLNSVVGNIGLLPTYHSLKKGKTVAVANKECLVTSGHILMDLAKENHTQILPVDSEHSAIFQALQGNDLNKVRRVILTASGGPFRETPRSDIERATFREALKHPNWHMGKKISIDSATLMNKGLEVIEAKWLYNLNVDQIEVVVHKESIIHSMVEYVDRSIMAQMSLPTMELPILYALSYPERLNAPLEPLDFSSLKQLSFERPRYEDFPCLDLAFESLRQGGLSPTILNAANEELVYMYLKDKIQFYDIPKWIEKAMHHFGNQKGDRIEDVLNMDQMTRQYIQSQLRR